MYILLYTNNTRLAKYMQESEINKNRRFKKIWYFLWLSNDQLAKLTGSCIST